ncbi:phage tail protein [Pseudomonas sp. TWI628]|uniref:phage tail assembly chaperone n=1 Tax=Pseudomonas sp. TWI628 TaxID=3136788 RepID=UPI00320B38E5
MAIFSSKSTRGFYDDAINSVIPDDAVVITPRLHAEIIAGPENNKMIEWGDDGVPLLIDRPAPTDVELAIMERQWRDGELSTWQWLRDRHRDEQELRRATTMSDDCFTELLTYLQVLRDWPQSEAFPDSQQRPQPPSWINLYTE